MGIFSPNNQSGMDAGVAEYRSTPGALLIDVRSREEYRTARITGSINVPLMEISSIGNVVSDAATPLFVYCHSGIRSAQAVAVLSEMGYTDVRNIGGIAAYTGKVER